MSQQIKPENIIELAEGKRSSNEILMTSLSLLIFKDKKEQNNQIKHIAVTGIIAILIASVTGIPINTLELVLKSTGLILQIFLAFLAIVFTGYSIFQAFMSDKMLEYMLRDRDNKKSGQPSSTLLYTNEYFINLMMLQTVLIFLTFLLVIILSAIPQRFNCFYFRAANCFLAIIGLSFYYYCCLIVFYEIKCFIFNIFQLFNLHAAGKAFKLLEQEQQRLAPDEIKSNIPDMSKY